MSTFYESAPVKMSLSEKKQEVDKNDYVYPENDVKQFIKDIKEGWASTDKMTKPLFMKLQTQIDQLAGERLI